MLPKTPDLIDGNKVNLNEAKNEEGLQVLLLFKLSLTVNRSKGMCQKANNIFF
jgi:hypothetical protein